MTINISFSKVLKNINLLLLIAILGLLVWSTPWGNSGSSTVARTIKVSGEATIEAVPDEFVFYPYFEMKGTDQETMKQALSKQSNQAVAKLKELGIEERKIKLDASSYDRWYWEEDEEGVLTVSLTITVGDKDKAQEVQDYLDTLDVKGQLTPQASFSRAKQKDLDAQAIEEASNDARSKAETQAKLFGSKLGKVVKVEQGSDSVFPTVFRGGADFAIAEEAAPQSSFAVLPGENEYTQTVSVIYEIK